jgi:hypothetical protein
MLVLWLLHEQFRDRRPYPSDCVFVMFASAPAGVVITILLWPCWKARLRREKPPLPKGIVVEWFERRRAERK